ncbi:MAG: alpha/beta hydrolase [Proteobacteria bacterium]|nr:alpha/beta hydrolase [Pseudomonadota bacterium]
MKPHDDSSLVLPHTYQFEGRAVRYGTLGSGNPLVLLHGTPFSSVVWRRIAPLLAPRRRLFFFDMLGYGQSDKQSGQDVSLAVQNRLFAALLAHWHLDRPDVVAHDFGGATALRAHLLNGCEYASLMLIDAVAVAPWGSPFVRHVRDHEAAFAGLPPYVHHAILETYISGAAHKSIRPEDLKLYVDPWTGEAGQAAFYRQISQMDQRYTDEVERLYGEIRCPVSILWGEQDNWIPLERGQSLAAKIPGASFKIIPGAGHLVQEDAPEAIVAALLAG